MTATADTFDVLEVNLNQLKVREIEDLEEAIGASIEVAFAAGAPRGRALRALAWIVKRRENPDFTLEEAGELTVILADDAPDPQPAPGS